MRVFVSPTGIEIRVGEDAKENGFMVKHSDQRFIWLHLDSMPSCHVVIQSPDPDQETMRHAQQLVKYFSKARDLFQVKVIAACITDVSRADLSKPGLVNVRKVIDRKVVKTDQKILDFYHLK